MLSRLFNFIFLLFFYFEILLNKSSNVGTLKLCWTSISPYEFFT